MMQIQPSRTNQLKDMLGIAGFVVAVLVGAWLINLFIFRSFNVDGPSMEDTLHTGDRLIVNRLPVTWSHLQNEPFIPSRGTVIVFKNPLYRAGVKDEYVVKRVIGLPGDRVMVKDGTVTVFNDANPKGIKFDEEFPGALQPTDGDVNTLVPKNELFVAGDHRQAGYSYDSRNGMGTIPFENVIGPVALRIYPFTQLRNF